MSSIIATDMPAHDLPACVCDDARPGVNYICAHTCVFSIEGDEVHATVDGLVCDEVRLLKEGVIVARATHVPMGALDDMAEECGGFQMWADHRRAAECEAVLKAAALRAS